MKIIDQTPFFNPETGELSLVDRGKAAMKYGLSWIDETKAQAALVPVLDNILDKNYTLLRNVTLPGLDTSIPFILIGPPGIYVLYVTNLNGMFRAKGDQWGTISGSTFKPEKPNLLTRTERMARAVQVYMQRQKYADLMLTVEAVLLCSNPGIHVDSLRPVVRVVMRDALERFAVSLSQARITLSPEMVHDIANRITNPPKPAAPAPAPAPVPAPAGADMTAAEAAAALTAAGISPSQPKKDSFDDAHVPAFALPENEAGAVDNSWSSDRLNFDFLDQTPSQGAAARSTSAPAPTAQGPAATPTAQPTVPSSPAAPAADQDNPFPFPDTPPQAPAAQKKKPALTRGQIIVLIVFGVIEVLILAALGYIVFNNFIF